jgi:hypothetical protein
LNRLHILHECFLVDIVSCRFGLLPLGCVKNSSLRDVIRYIGYLTLFAMLLVIRLDWGHVIVEILSSLNATRIRFGIKWRAPKTSITVTMNFGIIFDPQNLES